MPSFADAQPTCALCMRTLDTTMLRVIVWMGENNSPLPEAVAEDDPTAKFAVVHEDCFRRIMHPEYQL